MYAVFMPKHNDFSVEQGLRYLWPKHSSFFGVTRFAVSMAKAQ